MHHLFITGIFFMWLGITLLLFVLIFDRYNAPGKELLAALSIIPSGVAFGFFVAEIIQLLLK